MWRNLKNSVPHHGILVKLKHQIMGNGAPERQGWQSIGRRDENGKWSIKQNKENTVDFKPPTHWDWLPE